MKLGPILLMADQLIIPQLQNALQRSKVSIAHQQMAYYWYNQTDFTNSASTNRIDPFTDKPLKVEKKENQWTVASAGPNKTFDTGIEYAPSNGTMSKGDITWTVTR
jgi:hypothetical protein